MLKSTGIVRKMDNMGRFVVPVEIRKILKIEDNDNIEVFVDQDRVVLRKHVVGCLICGNTNNVMDVSGNPICEDCAEKILDAYKSE